MQNLQMIRALAALSVVTDHAIHFASLTLCPALLPFGPAADLIGETGVGAFFVLSGVIMASQVRNSRLRPNPAAYFLARRIGRIAPMYWLATAALLACGLSAAATDTHIIQSLLFIPYPNGADRPYPLLFQGWTLEYEMFFYLLCTASLLLRRVRGDTVLLALPCALAVLHRWQPFGPASYAGMAFNMVTDPLCLLFAAGLATGSILPRPDVTGAASRLYPALLLLVPMAAAAALPGLVARAGHGIDVLGDMAGAIVVITCVRSPPPRAGRFGRVLIALGNASYSIYLFHTVLLLAALKLLASCNVVPSATLFLLAGPALAVAGGVLLHLWVEKPLIRAVRSRPGRRLPGLISLLLTPAA